MSDMFFVTAVVISKLLYGRVCVKSFDWVASRYVARALLLLLLLSLCCCQSFSEGEFCELNLFIYLFAIFLLNSGNGLCQFRQDRIITCTPSTPLAQHNTTTILHNSNANNSTNNNNNNNNNSNISNNNNNNVRDSSTHHNSSEGPFCTSGLLGPNQYNMHDIKSFEPSAFFDILVRDIICLPPPYNFSKSYFLLLCRFTFFNFIHLNLLISKSLSFYIIFFATTGTTLSPW